MKNIKILLADDDQDDREFFAQAISSLDLKYPVEYFKDGTELLERIYNVDLALPDLVFLDLNMPIMSGYETLEQIREDRRFKNIPVIAIYSTSPHPDGIIKTFSFGANAYIIKPTSFNDLKMLLAKVLEMYCKDQFRQSTLESFIISI
jgi:CheY-like chemotaxis protein